MEKYAALIFDIVGSKKYENKERFIIQKKIIYIINFLNDRYNKQLIKNVRTIAGDEFQGLFKNVSSCYAYARELQILIYPTKIRIGIGYGALKYISESWDSFDIDGEAYYFARDALNNEENSNTDNIIFKFSSEEQLLINNYSKMYKSISNKILSQGHLIYSLLELYFPLFYVKNDFENPDINKVLDILELQDKSVERVYEKQISNIYKNEEISTINLFKQNNLDLIFECYKNLLSQWNPFETNFNKLLFNNPFPRGVLTFLELVTNRSKQNISHHLNRGIRQSRDAAISLIYFLKCIDKKENNL